MTREFLPHQRQAWAYAAPLNAIALFMQMRLGKTLVSIRWAESRPTDGPILVCAPLSVLLSWSDELQQEGLDHTLLVGSPEQRQEKFLEAAKRGCRWFLMNYEGLYRVQPKAERRRNAKRSALLPSELCLVPWHIVILDESTRVKSPTALATKAANNYLCHAPYRAILSGQPAPEGPLDYFEQMKFAFGRFLGCTNFYVYRDRTHEVGRNDWDLFPSPGSLKRIKEAVQSHAFCLTRRDAGVGSETRFMRRHVELPAKLRKLYETAERDFELGDEWTSWIPVVRTWLARISGGVVPSLGLVSEHKNDEIVDLLNGELKGEQAVVWFRFNEELFNTARRFKKEGIGTGLIYGNVDINERHRLRKLFQAGKLRTLLVQVKCGKQGLDMSAADTAIYYSRPYDYDSNAQSVDRIIHPTKTRPVMCLDIVTQDSVDVDVVDALGFKGVNATWFLKRVAENFAARVRRKINEGKHNLDRPGGLPRLGRLGPGDLEPTVLAKSRRRPPSQGRS